MVHACEYKHVYLYAYTCICVYTSMSSLTLIVEKGKRQRYLNSNEPNLMPKSWSLLTFPTEGKQTS